MPDQDAADRIIARAMGTSPDTTMMMVSPQGNTVVRTFPKNAIPGPFRREGVGLGPNDVRPQSTPFMQAEGNIARHAAARTLEDAATYGPMAIPGAGPGAIALRAGAGLAMGAGADAGARALRGQPQNLGGSLTAGGINMGAQLTGDIAAPFVASQAEPLAKASLGNALPGMEKMLLAAKTPVSNTGIAADQQFIAEQLAKAQAGIAGSKTVFSSAQIQRAIRARRTAVQKSDLLSTAEEDALGNALGVLQSKVGGGNKITPSSFMDQFGRQIPPTMTRIPPARLTAGDVDKINRYAEKEAKRLYEARAENTSSKPSDLESAYQKLAETTNAMLNMIPEVKAANAAVHSRIGLRNAKFDALKRSPGRLSSALIGSQVGEGVALATHNPWMLATALPAAGLTYAASTPAGLSKMAFTANDPLVQRLIAATPRVMYGAARDLTRR